MNKAVILLVFANDLNQPLDQVAKESQAIRKILRDSLDAHSDFEVELLPYSSAEDLFAELRRFQNQIVILHFAGHTTSDLWKLHEGMVNASGMAEVLKFQNSIRLLFLNGCHNHAQVEAFAKANIPVVIATSQPINDQQAQVFATEFYKKLVANKTLNTSIAEAYHWAKATASAIATSTRKRSIEGIDAWDACDEKDERADKDNNNTLDQWSWDLISTQSSVASDATQWSLGAAQIQPKINQQLADYKAKDLQNRWDRLTRKISLLQEQYDNETRVEEQLRIDSIVQKVIQDREQVEKQIEKQTQG